MWPEVSRGKSRFGSFETDNRLISVSFGLSDSTISSGSHCWRGADSERMLEDLEQKDKRKLNFANRAPNSSEKFGVNRKFFYCQVCMRCAHMPKAFLRTVTSARTFTFRISAIKSEAIYIRTLAQSADRFKPRVSILSIFRTDATKNTNEPKVIWSTESQKVLNFVAKTLLNMLVSEFAKRFRNCCRPVFEGSNCGEVIGQQGPSSSWQ